MFVISKTHVGMVRTVNEDALLTTGPELFAVFLNRRDYELMYFS